MIGLLATLTVAPITSTIRGLPSEVASGLNEGLKRRGAANLDHVQTVEKGRLRRFLESAFGEKMSEVCRALGIATGCL